MFKHKNNGAIKSEEIEHKEVLGITAIQNADGDAYVFTLWAHSTETPQYTVDISRKR